jgi:hypothetical protein
MSFETISDLRPLQNFAHKLQVLLAVPLIREQWNNSGNLYGKVLLKHFGFIIEVELCFAFWLLPL